MFSYAYVQAIRTILRYHIKRISLECKVFHKETFTCIITLAHVRIWHLWVWVWGVGVGAVGGNRVLWLGCIFGKMGAPWKIFAKKHKPGVLLFRTVLYCTEPIKSVDETGCNISYLYPSDMFL